MTLDEARAHLKCTTYELFAAAYVAKQGCLHRAIVDNAFAIHQKTQQCPWWVTQYIETQLTPTLMEAK